MHRIVLLALLGIPVLIVIHIALFWQGISLAEAMAGAPDGNLERPYLQGHWQTSDLPSRFVINRISEQGS
jgi:hypothetical protein